MPAFLALLAVHAAPAELGSGRLRVRVELIDGVPYVLLADGDTIWAAGPYACGVTLADGTELRGLSEARISAAPERLTVRGVLGDAMRLELAYTPAPDGSLDEWLTLTNTGERPLAIAAIGCGLRLPLATAADLRLVAVPYRRQADGKLHDYGVADLLAGRFSNSDWRNDGSVAEQEVCDSGRLRSEAWALCRGGRGLLAAKYNDEQIECSMAAIEGDGQAALLRYAGAGLALYREPRGATELAPGASFAFGRTRLTAFDGDWPAAYERYRAFLRAQGHGYPDDYAPPLNWNELFDVGWYHSDPELLQRHYTREALRREADKAREIGCDLLYLDPGWEICEGTTLWDTARLGPVAEFAAELRERYGLRLGYRTIGRVYRDEFPNAWYLRRQGQTGPYERPSTSPAAEPEPAPLRRADGRRNLALLPGVVAAASSTIAGYESIHRVEHLADGWYNNPASWVSAGDPSWVQLDLGAVCTIGELAFGSEHTPHHRDRAVTAFTARAASEPEGPWTEILSYDGEPLGATRSFAIAPVAARLVRIEIARADGGAARIDELEIYEATLGSGPEPARRERPAGAAPNPIPFWEVCTQSAEWQAEKIKRILAVTGGGVDFMMYDEFDWRGPCWDPNHGHAVPSTPEGHVRAVYALVEKMRERYPHVLVEAHDPIWPWTFRYLPSYFRQGFAGPRYQENWGFEFMWNPIEDLRSGRALCLYYYNLGCDIPLYDHITMEADNDACLSFWWYASTVRHLGIGGKKGLGSATDNEPRWQAYKRAVAEYHRLRPFFARGRFVGLGETAHLHVLNVAAVLNVFNLTDAPERREVRFDPLAVGLGEPRGLRVSGAAARVEGRELVLTFDLPPLSPALAEIR